MSFGASLLLGIALVVGADAADELRDAREHNVVLHQHDAGRTNVCEVRPDLGRAPSDTELPLSMEQRVRLCNEGLDWACPAPPGRYLGVLVLLALLVLVVFAAALPPRASKTAGK